MMKTGSKVLLGLLICTFIIKFCFCWEYGFREFYGTSNQISNEYFYQLLFKSHIDDIELIKEDKSSYQVLRLKEHPEVISEYTLSYQDARFYLATEKSRRSQKNRFLKAVYGLRLGLYYLDEVNEMLELLLSDQDGYQMELMIEWSDDRNEILSQVTDKELLQLLDKKGGCGSLTAHLYIVVDPDYTASLEELAENVVFELMQIFSDVHFDDLSVLMGESELLEEDKDKSLMHRLLYEKEQFLDIESFSFVQYVYQGKISDE